MRLRPLEAGSRSSVVGAVLLGSASVLIERLRLEPTHRAFTRGRSPEATSGIRVLSSSMTAAARLSPIRVAATRTQGFAESVREAHNLGYGPGSQNEPWTVDFQQRQAIAIYLKTLPPWHLRSTADAFAECAELMVTTAIPAELVEDWRIFESYLHSVAQAIHDVVPNQPPTDRIELSDRTPSVMSFALLAEVISAQGIERLRRAAAAVERFCDGPIPNPLSAEEVGVLCQIADGKRMLDIADAAGYSVRSLQRRLKKTWNRLGVANRTEGIAEAIRNGWLEPPHEQD